MSAPLLSACLSTSIVLAPIADAPGTIPSKYFLIIPHAMGLDLIQTEKCSLTQAMLVIPPRSTDLD